MPDTDKLDALLTSAALPEKTVEVCLRGDLVAEVEDLERQLTGHRSNTLADRGEARKLGERIESLRAEMKDSAAVFRLRGLNRKAWSSLIASHPPRRDNDTDRVFGYNSDTFFAALVRSCIVEPDMDDDQWSRLEDALSSGQFDELADAALAVSRRKVDVPFSFAAFASQQTSAETSSPQSA